MVKENEFIDKCEETIIHPDIVEKLKKEMLSEQKSYNLSEFFKIFGDLTRIRIIQLLLKGNKQKHQNIQKPRYKYA